MIMLRKIVIIEDDLFLQDFYRFFFKKVGGEVIILEDGDAIINVIETTIIDLIIIDINLRNTFLNSKKVDGIQLSRWIKEKYRSLRIPIILITAFPPSSFGGTLLEDSLADDYLLKPIVDYNILIEKINNLV